MHERYSKTYKPQPTFDLFFNVFMFLMTIVSDVSRVFWAKPYTHQTYESTTGAKWINFQNLCLQIL